MKEVRVENRSVGVHTLSSGRFVAIEEDVTMQCYVPTERNLLPFCTSNKASSALVTGILRLNPAKNTPVDGLSRTGVDGCK